MGSRLRGLAVALLAVFIALLLPPMPSAVAGEVAQGRPGYTYDGHHATARLADGVTERGPPTTLDNHIIDDAVDLWSHGTSARPSAATHAATTTYDDPWPLVHRAGATATTEEQVRRTDGDLAPFARAGVATKYGDELADACRTNSFTGETLVLMADGSRKPIKDVELGDWVMATDPMTGERGPRKVVDLIRHSGLHTMVAIQLAGGTTIDATDRHPFWVESRGEWVDAIDLKPGDVVVTADGDMLAVASVGVSEQDLRAFNLTVAGLHTYHVSASEVLVHNCIRNSHLAGSTHPKSGVPFDKDGFPDFSAWRHADVPDVRIQLTGSRSQDFRLANEAAGLARTPSGYTWHHHQDVGLMQLIRSDIHRMTGHTGGFSLR